VLTWLVATAAATGLAWAGVRSVVDGVAAPLPAPAVPSDGTRTPSDPPADEPSADPTGTPATPPAAGDDTTVRTFRLVGGTATVAFSPDGVEIVSAVPEPGFAADVEPEGSATRVEFESAGHRSRLDAWWDGGPRHEAEEQDQHGGGDGGGGDDDDRGDD